MSSQHSVKSLANKTSEECLWLEGQIKRAYVNKTGFLCSLPSNKSFRQPAVNRRDKHQFHYTKILPSDDRKWRSKERAGEPYHYVGLGNEHREWREEEKNAVTVRSLGPQRDLLGWVMLLLLWLRFYFFPSPFLPTPPAFPFIDVRPHRAGSLEDGLTATERERELFSLHLSKRFFFKDNSNRTDGMFKKRMKTIVFWRVYCIAVVTSVGCYHNSQVA